MESSRIILSEHLNKQELKRKHYIYTLFETLNSIFIKEKKNLYDVVTRGNITKLADYEKLLYVEPLPYIFGKDYVWEDIMKEADKNIKGTEKVRMKDYTDTEKLMAIVSDGEMKAIFLVGDIGCGKTTFIHHFKTIFDNEKQFCILIDYLKEGSEELEINRESDYLDMRSEHYKKIDSEIVKRLRKDGLYDEYLDYILENARHTAFSKFKVQSDRGEKIDQREFREIVTPWSAENPLKSISLGFRFLRTRGYNVLLVLDNADLIPGFYQERLARNALELVDLAEIQVLVSLRFYSFGQSYNVMSGYRWGYIMKIDLPPIKKLIKKRIDYFILNKMDKEQYTVRIESGITITVHKERISELLAFVNDNLLDKDLMGLLIRVSDLNIRFILASYMAILRSQHIRLSADLVYKFYEDRTKFREISPERSHDLLLKSLISSGEILYDHEKARIENVFHTYNISYFDYFPDLLKIYLVRVAYNMSVHQEGGEEKRTFFEKRVLVAEMEKLGWKKAAINDALQELTYRALFFGYDAHSFEYMNRIMLSNSGCLYHIRICRMVYYMFFMAFDFPIREDRLLKYFAKGEVNEFGEYQLSLREEFNSLLDDDFMHKLVSAFLLEMVELERDFIIESLKRPGAVQTYKAFVKQPISIALISSYIRHLDKAKKQGFDAIVTELESGVSALQNEFSEQVKFRS